MKKLKGKDMIKIHYGTCLELLKSLEDNSVDAMVTDPPYGLSDLPDIKEVLTHWMGGEEYEHGKAGFMSKTWDSFVPGPNIWKEVYRVLKPGAYAVVFASCRTVDLMGISLRLGGFVPRDLFAWLTGEGLSKGMNIGKALDKRAGVEREVIGPSGRHGGGTNLVYASDDWTKENMATIDMVKTAPATPEAAQWEGWNTQIKPANEPILLVQKPISEKTILDNVLKWGVGALNIDACRVSISSESGDEDNRSGRFPSNVLLSHIPDQLCPMCEGSGELREGHHPECEEIEEKIDGERQWIMLCHPDCEAPDKSELIGHCHHCDGSGWIRGCQRAGEKRVKGSHDTTGVWGGENVVYSPREVPFSQDTDTDGRETVEDWRCVKGCPVGELDCQGADRGLYRAGNKNTSDISGTRVTFGKYKPRPENPNYYADDQSNNVSRFYYTSKASRKERFFYCHTCRTVYPRKDIHHHKKHEVFHHPTQKPLRLIEWLVKLVSPPNGVIIDPFMGTGTTLVAARDHGLSFIGADIQEEAVKIAQYRIDVGLQKADALWDEKIEIATEPEPEPLKDVQGGLMGFFMDNEE